MSQQRSNDDLTAAHGIELLLNGILDHAIYMLDRGGFIRSWNAGAQNLYRYTREDAIGAHVAKLFTKQDQDHEVPKQILSKAAAAGRDESEGWRVRKDGSRFWALAVTEAIRDQHG